MKYASSVPEWQKDVVKFLSSHRKYRIFGWEFGPTLLDYLHRVKENKQPDYTKNGLIVTYSIVPVVALISFASTRRATFTAAATLGVMLFGVLITVAIDYQKTKRKNNGEEEYCLGLLEALDEAPKYWWWPWGKQIKDVEITEKEIERAIDYSNYSLISRLFYSLFTNVALHQLCIARYGYFYNYQELTEEKMPNISVPQPIKDGYEKAKNKCGKVCNAIGDGLSKAAGSVSSLISSTIKNEEVADKLEARSSNLIRKIFNVGDESTATLKKALESLEIEWLPLYLDKSLEGVRAGTKTIEDHNKYFNEQVREIVKLSLTYHPDKQEQNVNTNTEQGLINNVTKALRNIHDYVTKDKSMHENRVVYRLFEDAPIKNIVDRDALKVANIVARCELSSLAFWEGEILMRGRNKYLDSARNDLGVLSKLPGNSLDIIDDIRKTFDKSYDNYRNLYQEKWIKNLEELSRKCMGVKELEIVKGDVDMLLKESEEQYKILESHELVEADKMFVQPILEYFILMNVYFAFFNVVGGKNMSEYYSERNLISEEVKQDIEKLSRQELLKSAQNTCIKLADKLTENEKGELENQERNNIRKELGKVLFLKLERVAKLLEEEFEVKKTLMQREEERIEAEIEGRRKKLEAIENETKEAQEGERQAQEGERQEAQARRDAEQKAEQEAQARRDAEQKAKQLEQALEQKNLEKVAIRACNRKLVKLDDELQDAINEESEDKIVEAAMSYTRGSPEQVIDAIIEEIKINRDQIIKEGKVSAEIIKAGVKSFSNHGTSLSDVNVSHGASAGMGRDSGAGI